jgi:transposase
MKGTYFTGRQIKDELLKEFPEIGEISLPTIYSLLKSNLNMSYRKLSKFHKSLLKKSNVRMMHESLYIQHKLISLGYELLYIDEFSFQTRNLNSYGWAVKGEKGYIEQYSDNFSMSLIVCFSKTRIMGVIGNETSNNSKTFIKFVKKIIKKNSNIKCIKEKKFILVFDNASIHTSSITSEYFEDKNISALTIPPYSPWLNPSEKLINAIKSKITMAVKQLK